MQCLVGAPLHAMGYGYQAARAMLTPWSHRWYDRIDDTLYLGDRPTQNILEETGVGAVVNLTEWPGSIDYDSMDVHHIQIPVSRAPAHVLFEVVGIIDAYRADGISTYVHDSAQGGAVALAWLSFMSRDTPLADLNAQLSAARYQVPETLHTDTCILRFHDGLSGTK